MMKNVVGKIAICIGITGFCFYSHIDKQNHLTSLQIELPKLAKEVQMLQEENTRLQYELEALENPQHLLELVRGVEFSHLKHPLYKEVLTLQEGQPVEMINERLPEGGALMPNIVVGAKK